MNRSPLYDVRLHSIEKGMCPTIPRARCRGQSMAKHGKTASRVKEGYTSSVGVLGHHKVRSKAKVHKREGEKEKKKG